MVLTALLSALVVVGAGAVETHSPLHGSLVPGDTVLRAGRGSQVGSHAEVPLRVSGTASVPAAEFAATSRGICADMIETDSQVARHGDQHGHGVQRRRVGDRGADAACERPLRIAADGSGDTGSTGGCGCSTGCC